MHILSLVYDKRNLYAHATQKPSCMMKWNIYTFLILYASKRKKEENQN